MSAPAFRAPRDRVLELLEAALAPEVMAEAYPGVQPPAVSVGGRPSQPPCEVIVRELPANVTFDRVSTCPMPRATWTIEVDLMATNADLVRASDPGRHRPHGDARDLLRRHERHVQGLLRRGDSGGRPVRERPRQQ